MSCWGLNPLREITAESEGSLRITCRQRHFYNVPRDANSTDINKILFSLSPRRRLPAQHTHSTVHSIVEREWNEIRTECIYYSSSRSNSWGLFSIKANIARVRERSNNSQIDKATNFVLFLISLISYLSSPNTPTTCRLFSFLSYVVSLVLLLWER